MENKLTQIRPTHKLQIMTYTRIFGYIKYSNNEKYMSISNGRRFPKVLFWDHNIRSR